jgi:hypothetical protein
MSKQSRQARMLSAGEQKILYKLTETDRFLCKRMHTACHAGKPYIAEFYHALLDMKYDECRNGIKEIRKARRG